MSEIAAERYDLAAIESSTVTCPPVEPVGIKEIAQRLGLAAQTVQNWRSGEQFPGPRWTVGGRPVWCWHLDVVPWARATGRLTVGRGTWQQHTEAGEADCWHLDDNGEESPCPDDCPGLMTPLFEEVTMVNIPQWTGIHDRLLVYRRRVA